MTAVAVCIVVVGSGKGQPTILHLLGSHVVSIVDFDRPELFDIRVCSVRASGRGGLGMRSPACPCMAARIDAHGSHDFNLAVHAVQPSRARFVKVVVSA